MARYAVAKVNGNGGPPRSALRGGATEATGPFRPAIDGWEGAFRCLITNTNWCLLVIFSGDINALDALPKVRVLPDRALSHVLTTVQAAAVNSQLTDMGAPTVASAGMTVHEVLNALRLALGDETWMVD